MLMLVFAFVRVLMLVFAFVRVLVLVLVGVRVPGADERGIEIDGRLAVVLVSPVPGARGEPQEPLKR